MRILLSPWNVKQCEAIVTLDGMQTEADLVADSLSERIRKPMTEMHTGLLPRERERETERQAMAYTRYCYCEWFFPPNLRLTSSSSVVRWIEQGILSVS